MPKEIDMRLISLALLNAEQQRGEAALQSPKVLAAKLIAELEEFGNEEQGTLDQLSEAADLAYYLVCLNKAVWYLLKENGWSLATAKIAAVAKYTERVLHGKDKSLERCAVSVAVYGSPPSVFVERGSKE